MSKDANKHQDKNQVPKTCANFLEYIYPLTFLRSKYCEGAIARQNPIAKEE